MQEWHVLPAGWEAAARDRIGQEPEIAQYAAVLLADAEAQDRASHWEWLATAATEAVVALGWALSL